MLPVPFDRNPFHSLHSDAARSANLSPLAPRSGRKAGIFELPFVEGVFELIGRRPGLLPDDEDDELVDDVGPGPLVHLQKRGMALPLELKAQNGEVLFFVVLFTEKRSTRKILLIEKEFIVGKRTPDGSQDHFPAGAVKVPKGGGPKNIKKAQRGKRLRRSCTKAGRRSKNERPAKAAKMTETGKLLWVASDVSKR